MSKCTFYCSKCNSRLRLDDSLLKLNQAQLNLLSHTRSDGRREEQSQVTDPSHFIQKNRIDLYNEIIKTNPEPLHKMSFVSTSTDNSEASKDTNSFVMLSHDESTADKHSDGVTHDVSNYRSISARINTLKKVFEILSTNLEVEHPLCLDCADLLLSNYKLKFDQTQLEKEYYMSFLRKLKQQDVSGSISDIDSKLKESLENFRKLQKEETEKLEVLKQLEKERDKLNHQLDLLNEEMDNLNNNDLNNFLKLRNHLDIDLSMKREMLNLFKSLYQIQLNRLDSVRNLNIYTKMFQISFETADEYGRINGFRLGYKVPWPEINSALGQVTLLLIFIIGRLDLKLKDYTLIPKGSNSQIIKFSANATTSGTPHKSVLNLYSSNEFSLGKLFNYNKLDVTMIAVLDILSQIEACLSNIDSEIELPYRISEKHDNIGGKSIRLSSLNEWTTSCKFLLTDLNWLLTYASAYSRSST